MWSLQMPCNLLKTALVPVIYLSNISNLPNKKSQDLSNPGFLERRQELNLITSDLRKIFIILRKALKINSILPDFWEF